MIMVLQIKRKWKMGHFCSIFSEIDFLSADVCGGRKPMRTQAPPHSTTVNIITGFLRTIPLQPCHTGAVININGDRVFYIITI